MKFSFPVFFAAALSTASCGRGIQSSETELSLLPSLGVNGLFPKAAITDFDPTYAPHYDNVIRFADEVEAKKSGFLTVVGIQVFDKYQAKIDKYMSSGDFGFLTDKSEDPDLEVLGGHLGSAAIAGHTRVFQKIIAMNKLRKEGNKIRIVAMDMAPDSKMSLRQWKQAKSEKEIRAWELGRDEYMYKKMSPIIKTEAGKVKFTALFAMPMHVIRQGIIRFQFPRETPAQLDVTPLASRLARDFGSDFYAIHTNNPEDACVDKVEAKMMADGISEVTNFELKETGYGSIDSFHCSKEYGKHLYFYSPGPYYAKDHYDNYVFMPK